MSQNNIKYKKKSKKSPKNKQQNQQQNQQKKQLPKANNPDLYSPILKDSDLLVSVHEEPKKVETIHYNIKLCLIGNTLSGKTSYIDYLINNRFSIEQNPTIGVDYNVYKYNYKDKTYKFCIWDTSGMDSYYGITKSYFDSTNIYVVFVDLSNPQSINSIKFWIDEVNKYRYSSKRLEVKNNKPYFLVVGSKCDKNAFESADNYINKLCYEYKTEFIKISIKDNLNINEPFNNIIKYIEQNKKTEIYGITKLVESFHDVNLNNNNTNDNIESKNCCCNIL